MEDVLMLSYEIENLLFSYLIEFEIIWHNINKFPTCVCFVIQYFRNKIVNSYWIVIHFKQSLIYYMMSCLELAAQIWCNFNTSGIALYCPDDSKTIMPPLIAISIIFID